MRHSRPSPVGANRGGWLVGYPQGWVMSALAGSQGWCEPEPCHAEVWMDVGAGTRDLVPPVGKTVVLIMGDGSGRLKVLIPSLDRLGAGEAEEGHRAGVHRLRLRPPSLPSIRPRKPPGRISSTLATPSD